MTESRQKRISFLDRVLGSLGGGVVGLFVGLTIFAFRDFSDGLLFLTAIVSFGGIFVAVLGFILPKSTLPFAYFVFLALSGDEDSDLPWHIFLAVVAALMGMLVMMLATLFQSQLIFMIGLSSLIPFAILAYRNQPEQPGAG